MIITGITVEQFKDAVARAGALYGNNLRAEIGTRYSETRFNARVVLAHTAYQMYGRGTQLAPGQKRSWQGRRTNAVCWHVYRDVLAQVFTINPDARVRTMYAKYLGLEGFLREYPKTANLNVGSMAQPARPTDLCDCDSNILPIGVPPMAPVLVLVPKPTKEEQEMIEWWEQQRKRTLARTGETK